MIQDQAFFAGNGPVLAKENNAVLDIWIAPLSMICQWASLEGAIRCVTPLAKDPAIACETMPCG